MEENKKAPAKQQIGANTSTKVETPALDAYGNPAGTTYEQTGKAIALDGGLDSSITLKDLPNDEKFSLVYEADGSVWKKPENLDKQIMECRNSIASCNVAINTSMNNINSAKSMQATSPDDMKPLFDKAIELQEVALASRKTEKEKLEELLKELTYSGLTPGERSAKSEYDKLIIERAKLDSRIKELTNRIKAFNPTEAAPEKISTVTARSATAQNRTKEQEDNYKRLVTDMKITQGQAVINLVKDGKTNAEIAKTLGISEASVPGPKNNWLRNTEEGMKYHVVEGRAILKA